MSCKYAFEAGYHKAVTKFHNKINEKMEESIRCSKELGSHDFKYWREIGKRDVLLDLIGVVSEMISRGAD